MSVTEMRPMDSTAYNYDHIPTNHRPPSRGAQPMKTECVADDLSSLVEQTSMISESAILDDAILDSTSNKSPEQLLLSQQSCQNQQGNNVDYAGYSEGNADFGDVGPPWEQGFRVEGEMGRERTPVSCIPPRVSRLLEQHLELEQSWELVAYHLKFSNLQIQVR